MSYEFGLHLKQCGIVSQLTPPGTPQRNGVSERRNRTLLYKVQSMMPLTNLPISFWGYAFEIATFTLNRAPSKSIEMTPYELFKCFRLMFHQVDIPISAQIICEGKKITIPAASFSTHRIAYISMYYFQ